MTDDLVAFVRARLDEDERTARAAGGDSWRAGDPGLYHEDASHDPGAFAVGPYGDIGDEAQHMARHDPARVLAEVTAKRRMLDEHKVYPRNAGGTRDFDFGCGTCHVANDGSTYGGGWCTTLCLLALPYAEHPDYREEWRP